MQIRLAEHRDLPAIEQLFSLPELLMADGSAIDVEIMEKYVGDKYFLVAEEDDLIVGALFGEELKNGGVMIWELAVKNEWRGKGVGTALVSFLENKIKESGGGWIISYAPVGSEKTVRFYEKNEFSHRQKFVEFLKSVD